MNSYSTLRKANSGISLIEALISLLVLSFGLLAIASFQGSLVIGSGYNKTRSEAMALAQQKLDDIRGYTTQEEQVAKLKEQVDVDGNLVVTPGELFPEHAFDDFGTTPLPTNVVVTACNFSAPTPPYTTVPDNNNPLAGTNADYTRLWRYCVADNELLYAVVEVSWTDMEGNTDMVSLESAISWKNPAASVQLAEIPEEPQVPSATGRAYLGDGKVSDADLASKDAVDNKDGTFTLYKANDGSDVALVDAVSKEIVLTLEDACKLDDPAINCFEFVKVKGRVYFNRGKNTEKGSGLAASSVYVLASDAAYCARVITNPVASTANGNYEYYDYTCYLGGGWYGNIGLLLTGNSVNDGDRVCLGDPNATTSGYDDWKRKELAKRRVYRGMTYVRSADDYNRWVVDHAANTAPVDDGVNLPLYYSKGVADGIMYPDLMRIRDPGGSLEWHYLDTTDGLYKAAYPGLNGEAVYPGRGVGHDYVVMSSTGQADADDCTIPLTRPDSAVTDITGDGTNDVGTLFSGMPSDFICLNDEYVNPNIDPTTAEAIADPTILHLNAGFYNPVNDYLNDKYDPVFRGYPYLDNFNGQTVDGTSGLVATTSVDTNKTVYGAESFCPWDPSRPPSNMHLISGTVKNITSSGAYLLDGLKMTTSDGPADCWFVDGTGTKVELPTGTSFDYVCRVFEWGDGWTGSVNLEAATLPKVECDALVHTYDTPTITGDKATSAEDFSCKNLAKMTITGSLTAYMNDIGADKGTTVSAVRTNADGSTTTEACTVTPAAGTVATYTCVVYEETAGSGWTGKVVAIPPTNIISCDTTEQAVTIDPAVQADVTAFDTHCKGTNDTLEITGIINGINDLTAVAPSMLTVTATGATDCTLKPVVGTNDYTYTCDVPFHYINGFTGSVTVLEPGDGSITCSGDTSWTPASGLTSNSTSTAVVSCGVGEFIRVYGNLTVAWPHEATYCGPNFSDSNCADFSWTDATVVTLSMTGGVNDPNGTCSPTAVVPADYTAEQVGQNAVFTGTATSPPNSIMGYECLVETAWNNKWTGTLNFNVTPVTAYWATSVTVTGTNLTPGTSYTWSGSVQP